jgi:hypothetical protein
LSKRALQRPEEAGGVAAYCRPAAMAGLLLWHPPGGCTNVNGIVFAFWIVTAR